MILVVGLSPAWQRTLEYERFIVGKVNRALWGERNGIGERRQCCPRGEPVGRQSPVVDRRGRRDGRTPGPVAQGQSTPCANYPCPLRNADLSDDY